MAKEKAAQTTTDKPQPQKPARKIPGFKITVTGQVVVKDDRRRDVKKYEETFFLTDVYRPRVLGVVVVCLLPYRLAKKFDNFANIRTHEIKGALVPVEDVGLAELEKKPLWDLEGEEVRHYALLKELKIPERNAEKKIIRVLDAVQVIKNTKVEFDLKEKLEKFLKESPKPLKVEVDPADAEEAVEEGGDGILAKTEWGALEE